MEKPLLKRTLLLETVGVGCGPVCMCRAALADTLTDSQAELIEKLAKGVIFEKKEPVGEMGLLTELGATILDVQKTLLRHIAEDKLQPDREPHVKGGTRSALESIEQFLAIAEIAMLAKILSGGDDIANMSDLDIRTAAYSRGD